MFSIAAPPGIVASSARGFWFLHKFTNSQSDSSVPGRAACLRAWSSASKVRWWGLEEAGPGERRLGHWRGLPPEKAKVRFVGP